MQKRKKRGHNWFAYILGIVVLICLGIIAQQEYKIYQLKQEKAATEARIDALSEKHANLEAERRECADNKIVCYANGTFATKLINDYTAGTTTTAMQTFNPLCCCGQNK